MLYPRITGTDHLATPLSAAHLPLSLSMLIQLCWCQKVIGFVLLSCLILIGEFSLSPQPLPLLCCSATHIQLITGQSCSYAVTSLNL